MIEGRLIRDGVVEDRMVPLTELEDAVAGAEGAWVWFDLLDPAAADVEELGRHLHLHPLTVEDAQHRGQAPKAELFDGQQLFIVMRPLSMAGTEIRETELHVVAAPTFLLTLRFTPALDLAPVLDRCRRQPEMSALGMGFALYAVCDIVVDGYLGVIEHLEDVVDDLEDRVLSTEWNPATEPDLQSRLLTLRRGTVTVRRRAIPMREGVELLGSLPSTGVALTPYLRDVLDHLMRIGEMVDAIRDLIMSLLDVRTAQAANRMNEVMKSLTAWATILLVPTLLTGIWGMNFTNMPDLQWRYGYLLALGAIVGSALGLYAWFRWKKRWL